MTEFYHPYQFVAATGKINGKSSATVPYADIKSGSNKINARHDIWQQGMFSGRMICSVKLDSPAFIGQQRDNTTSPAMVAPFTRLVEGKPTAILPGSSLRGMVGSVAEMLSQSALRVLDDRKLMVRKTILQSLPAIGWIEAGNKSDKFSSFSILPLTFATRWQPGRNGFELPNEQWKKLFSGRALGNVLPVYINGYSNGRPYGDLTRNNMASFPSSDSSGEFQVFYALLDKKLLEYDASDEVPAHLDSLYVKNNRFLLGQRFRRDRGKLPELIDEAYYQDKLNESEREEYTKGFIRVLDFEGKEDMMPNTKKHEIFIPWPILGEAKRLAPVTLQGVRNYNALCYDAMAREPGKLPLTLKGNAYPGSGVKAWQVGVGKLFYFDIDSDGYAHEVSLSCVWRYSLPDTTYDFFEKSMGCNNNLLPWNQKRSHLTPAEALFGVVQNDKDDDEKNSRNLASRLSFSDGLPKQGTMLGDQLDEAITLKILSSPKPPSPAMYFDNGSGKLIPKQELVAGKHKPNGRKVYLHHPEVLQDTSGRKKPWRTADDQLHRDQKVKVTPLKRDQEFYFHIDFENLSPAELGLLKKSIQPDEEFRHHLGMGKSLGLGSIKVNVEGIFEVDRVQRYSAEGLDSGRYCKGWLRQGGLSGWRNCYTEEAELSEQLSFDLEYFGRDSEYRHLIDGDTLKDVRGIGDVENLKSKVPVQFPLAEGQAAETEGFNWFVNNTPSAKGHPVGFALGPVKAGKVPTLQRNREHPKPQKKQWRR